jgi:centromere/kinetochore protein ZW10
VPSSLDDMVHYQKALALVQDFADTLDSLKWPGADGLHDWVASSPKIWLSKRRETALDWTRNQLTLGLGTPLVTERIETRMVARDEGQHISQTGTTVTDDWDEAWNSDAEEPVSPQSTRNRNSVDEEHRNSGVSSKSSQLNFGCKKMPPPPPQT